MSSGLTGYDGPLVALGGSLYEIGAFSTAGGVPAQCIAAWNGTTWAALGAGVPNTPNSLCIYNGQIYVGGGLAGGAGAYVCAWNGTSSARITIPGGYGEF
jgi:hypothetical protein